MKGWLTSWAEWIRKTQSSSRYSKQHTTWSLLIMHNWNFQWKTLDYGKRKPQIVKPQRRGYCCSIRAYEMKNEGKRVGGWPEGRQSDQRLEGNGKLANPKEWFKGKYRCTGPEAGGCSASLRDSREATWHNHHSLCYTCWRPTWATRWGTASAGRRQKGTDLTHTPQTVPISMWVSWPPVRLGHPVAVLQTGAPCCCIMNWALLLLSYGHGKLPFPRSGNFDSA